MKKIGMLCSLCLCLLLCLSSAVAQSPHTVLEDMLAANAAFMRSTDNDALIGVQRRAETAEHGQSPYAVVITCSDSRVPPEHLFLAGIGDLFVVRTAGNVIGDFELGSVEYGVEHLGAPIVMVLGHSGCGAVAATLDGHAEGSIHAIVEEIAEAIGAETDPAVAEDLNILHGVARVMESEMVRALVAEGKLVVVPAKYDLHTGEVSLLGE